MDNLFLKKLDGVVGTLLARLLPRPAKANIPSIPPRRMLLIRPGGIGDAVLLVPAIRLLTKSFPGCEVTVLAERRNGSVFVLCPEVAHVLHYDHPRQLLASLRQRFDVVIDTEQWHRLSAIVARLVRSRMKIGFGTNERQRLFHAAVPYGHENYEAHSFLGLLEPLGIESRKVDSPFLQVPAHIEKGADEFLAPLGGRPFVAFFPGASIPERRWAAEKFHHLTGRLNGLGLQVVVVGGGQDQVAGDTILDGCQGINLAGKTSLPETAAVLNRSRLLVSGDSGVLHLAVGLDVPTVSLFGPGIAAKWAPKGEKHIVINQNLACSPCTRFGYTPSCPEGGRCIQDISVDEVEAAVSTLLTTDN